MNGNSEIPPLVLLAGLLCDRYMWEEVGEILSDVADVSIFSFAGFDSISAMAEKVLAEGPKCFSLAGHSMGGRVAIEIYRQAPQRVKRLALINTGVHPRTEREVPGRKRLLDLSVDVGMEAVADAWLPPMMSEEGRKNIVLFERLRRMVLRHSSHDLSGQIQALLNREDAQEVLPMIRVPTLLMSGSEDHWSPVSQHEKIQRKIPGSKLVALKGVGHMSTVEDPHNVAKAMREWLKMDEYRNDI